MTLFQKLKGEKPWPRFAKDNSPGKQGTEAGDSGSGTGHRGKGESRVQHCLGLRLGAPQASVTLSRYLVCGSNR